MTGDGCIIYFAGEATMVEYGVDEALGSIRTSHVNRHVLSLRLNERPMRAAVGDAHDNMRPRR